MKILNNLPKTSCENFIIFCKSTMGQFSDWHECSNTPDESDLSLIDSIFIVHSVDCIQNKSDQWQAKWCQDNPLSFLCWGGFWITTGGFTTTVLVSRGQWTTTFTTSTGTTTITTCSATCSTAVAFWWNSSLFWRFTFKKFLKTKIFYLRINQKNTHFFEIFISLEFFLLGWSSIGILNHLVQKM